MKMHVLECIHTVVLFHSNASLYCYHQQDKEADSKMTLYAHHQLYFHQPHLFINLHIFKNTSINVRIDIYTSNAYISFTGNTRVAFGSCRCSITFLQRNRCFLHGVTGAQGLLSKCVFYVKITFVFKNQSHYSGVQGQRVKNLIQRKL